MVEFISYSGKWPCLCSGTLILKIDGKRVEFRNALLSNGSVWFDDDWTAHVEEGFWSVSSYDLTEEYLPYLEEIEKVVNENVPYGCCGGCV